MTRTEFSEIQDWQELMDFSDEIGCDAFVDAFWGYDADSFVSDDIDDYMRFNGDWEGLRNELDDLDFSGGIYIKDGRFDYREISGDFGEYKDYVFEFCEDHGCFDDEDEDEEEDETEEEDEECEDDTDEEAFDDDITLAEFLMPSEAVA